MNEKPTAEGLLYRYNNDRLFSALVDQLVARCIAESNPLKPYLDKAEKALEAMTRETERLKNGLEAIRSTGFNSNPSDYHALPAVAESILNGETLSHSAEMVKAHCEAKERLAKERDSALASLKTAREALETVVKFDDAAIESLRGVGIIIEPETQAITDKCRAAIAALAAITPTEQV